METWGNCLRFLYRKCIKQVKKLFCHQLLLLLRREIFLCGDILKVQHVMLIKWENFGAFLSWCLRWENILTGDIWSEFHCITIFLYFDGLLIVSKTWQYSVTLKWLMNFILCLYISVWTFHWSYRTIIIRWNLVLGLKLTFNV